QKTILILIAKGLFFPAIGYSLIDGKTYLQINLKPTGFPKSLRVQLAPQYPNNSKTKRAIFKLSKNNRNHTQISTFAFMRILVIEDETTLNKNISEAISSENFAVESVFDGFLAERLLKKESFDCIIMDINLPKKNGYDLCKEFRTYNTHTPVLMLTAFDE